MGAGLRHGRRKPSESDGRTVTAGPSRTWAELFEEGAAYYLAIGMPLDEYWHGPPYLVHYYQEAHRLKMQEINQMLWVQGLYVKSALDATVGNLLKKKGANLNKYIEKPLDIIPKSKREKELEEEEAARKMEAYFDRLIAKQNRKKSGEMSGGSRS